MEVFIRFNCFSLLSFLYLIVTSDLPPGAHGTRSKAGLLDSASSAINDKHFYNIGLPVSSHKNVFPPSSSSPSSFHSPSMATSTSSTNSGKRTLPNTNNANNNILLILSSNHNKRSTSPPTFKASYEDEGDVSRDMIIASVSGRGRNNRHHRNEETTTTIGWSGRIANNNKLTVPRAEEGSGSGSRSRDFSHSLSSYPDGVNPLPVAYLMNSLYELESPPLLAHPVDGGELAGGSSAILSRSSSSRARQTVRGSASDDLVMLLQNNNNNGDNNEPDSNNRDNREIPSVLTTPSPLLSAAVVADPLSTSFPPLESIQIKTTSSTSLNDGDDDSSAGVEDGSENVRTTEDPASVTQGTTALRGKCNETSQCFGEYVECRVGICKCQLGYLPRIDNGDLCGEASAHHVEVPTTDPTMIGVVVGLALMSVTLCIVLRLFAKARFRENRTIFNTPNPRLMNVSLLKGSKTLLRGNSAGQRSRRGSQASVASGQGDGQSSISATPDGNGTAATAGSSHHPHRVKPSRTSSTDTNNLEGTPTSTRPLPAVNRSKFRQDSVASNV